MQFPFPHSAGRPWKCEWSKQVISVYIVELFQLAVEECWQLFEKTTFLNLFSAHNYQSSGHPRRLYSNQFFGRIWKLVAWGKNNRQPSQSKATCTTVLYCQCLIARSWQSLICLSQAFSCVFNMCKKVFKLLENSFNIKLIEVLEH